MVDRIHSSRSIVTTPTNAEKDRLTYPQQRLRRAMMTRLEHHTSQEQLRLLERCQASDPRLGLRCLFLEMSGSINCQLSTVNCQLSTINYQLSANSRMDRTVRHRRSS